jgi:hypothetical protein
MSCSCTSDSAWQKRFVMEKDASLISCSGLSVHCAISNKRSYSFGHKCGKCLHNHLLHLVSSDECSPSHKSDGSSSPASLFPSTICSTEKILRGRKAKFSFLYSLFGHSSKSKVKLKFPSSSWMQRLKQHGKRRKCHVDNVKPNSNSYQYI